MSGQQIAISPDAFGQFRVKELGESDFWLGSALPTALKSGKCHIVLFYEPVTVDPELINIWNLLAQTISGPVIAAVNTSARGEVMDAFMAVGADVDHPLYEFTGFGVPTILVYRNRWPQAFYNGEITFNLLKKYILTLACRPGYKEKRSLYSGVRSIEPDIYTADARVENYAYPTSSEDFRYDHLGENQPQYDDGQDFEEEPQDGGEQQDQQQSEEDQQQYDEEQPQETPQQRQTGNNSDVGFITD